MRNHGFFQRVLCVLLIVLGHVTGFAQWAQSARNGEVAYFLFGTSPRLERYSLSSNQWLAPIKLPTIYGTATAFALDADTLFVAYGQSVKRYTLSGSNELHVINTPDPVREIFIDGNVVLLNRSTSLYARLTSIDKSNNGVITQFENYIDALGGASFAPSINKIFGRSMGISPSDITYVSYNDDGTFVGGGDSPHHGDYPGASRTWVFPSETKVVDDSGTVYSTANLSRLNSFGGSITDLDFYGTNIPVVLRGSNLVAYSAALLPAGSYTLPVNPKTIHVVGTNVVAFTWDAASTNEIRVDSVPLALLNPPTPGQAIDPNGLSYTPDATFLDTNGVLYLLSKTHQSLFRWDCSNQVYLSTIPLLDSPSYAAYSAQSHKVYLAYSSGLIRHLDLSATNLYETPFAILATWPRGLATAEQYVFAMDSSGAWGTHYTFAPDGNLLDSVDWNYYSSEFIWSKVRRRMYFLRDDTSPNDLHSEGISEDGQISGAMESPLHTSEGFYHPIRVSPDGMIVVLGSGLLHDATTLSRLALNLGNSINDAAWVDGQLRTIRTISGVAQLQEWKAPNYGLGKIRQLPGAAHRLMELGPGRLLAICLMGSAPSFYVLDGQFNVIPPPNLAPPTGVAAGVASSSMITLAWTDTTGEETYSIERKTGASGNWQPVGTAATSATNFVDASVLAGNTYFYRVIALNGGQSSSPSAETTAVLMAPSTPTNIAAQALSSSSIRVTWNDVLYETGYYLEMKSGLSGTWSGLAVPGGTTSYTHTGLYANTEYSYRVTANNGMGASAVSAVVTAKTHPVPPTTPVLYSASATGPTAVALYWSNASYEDGYVIDRRSGTNTAWVYLASVAADFTSFTDLSVSPSTFYQYRVSATNILGGSGYSSSNGVTTPQIPAPATPATLTARPLSVSSVFLTWSDVSFESGYRVERYWEGTNGWKVVAVLPANTNTFTDTGLVEGVQYWYRVQATNQFGSSAFSATAIATPTAIADVIKDDFDPEPDGTHWESILGGSATNGGPGFQASKALYFGGMATRSATTVPLRILREGTISFIIRAGNEALDGTAWNNSESGETVVVEYSINRGSTWATIQTLNTVYPALTNWTSYTLMLPSGALEHDTQLRWRQVTHSGVGADCWAIDDVVVQGTIPPPPQAVPFIISSPSSSTSVAVYWIGVEAATSYVLERKLGTGTWAAIASLPGSITYYTDMGLIPGTPCAYRVRAVNAAGHSPYSLVTTSITWSQLADWVFSNYGTLDAMQDGGLTKTDSEGLQPIVRFAFNLSADEPKHVLGANQSGGLPAITLDAGLNRLCVEFVRRRKDMNPGLAYQVQFSSDLLHWVNSAEPVSVVPIDSMWERVRCEDVIARDQAAGRFCRVLVVQ